MATNPPLLDEEEDYIDIEVNSYSSYFSCPSTISSPQNREFEFQMASITNDKKTTSPADELFFKGKLLPLHQKILPTYSFEEDEEESFCINFVITSNSNSPIRSCNNSTSEYCRVSFELNPNEWFSNELTASSIDDNNNSPTKLWSNKLKLMSQKIKASREFLKSLFTKYSCKKTPLKSSNGILCGASPTLASIIKNVDRGDDNVNNNYSRSFSAAEIKWHSPTKSLSSSSTNSSFGGSTSFSSSSCSFNSNSGFYDLSLLKRSHSFTSEMGLIEAAIAHCKKSLELNNQSNKTN